MPNRKKNKGEQVLHKIHLAAKRIRKSHPSIKWMSAVKQASREYMANKKTKTVHKKRKKISGVSKSHVDKVDRKRVDVTIGSISKAHAKRIILERTKEQLAFALLHRDQSKLKTHKHKLTKKINELRHELYAYGH